MSEERRHDYSEMKQDIALIKQDINYIKEAVGDLKPIRDKAATIDLFKRSFDDHTIADRWMFGILITIQLAMFTKIAGVW